MYPRHPFALRIIALGLTALIAGPATAQDTPREGHSHQSHVFNEGPRQAAYLMPGTGDVHFPVRTVDPLAQRYFDQGVGQLHGFWYFEAERSFRQVALLDPDCALAYWGMCMANVNNPRRARGLIAQAMARRNHASARGRMWIDAYARFYQVSETDLPKLLLRERDPKAKEPKRDAKRLSRELIRDLEHIALRHPDDVEAKAFLANRIWLNQWQHAIPSHYAVHALQDAIFAAAPMHPTHHYRIHLWDREDASRALESAAKIGPSAPGIAHMWHMAGHIYAKLNRHADAAWQQEASARVDHAHMIRDAVMPFEIHNYGHNNEWTTRSLQHVGRAREAIALAANMLAQPRHPEKNRLDRSSSIAGYGRRRLIESLTTYELWGNLRQELDDGLLAETATAKTDAKGPRNDPHALARDRFQRLAQACYRLGELDAAEQHRQRWDELVRARRNDRTHAMEEAERTARDAGKSEDEVMKAMTSTLRGYSRALSRLEQTGRVLDIERALANARIDEAVKLVETLKPADSVLAFEVRLRQLRQLDQKARRTEHTSPEVAAADATDSKAASSTARGSRAGASKAAGPKGGGPQVGDSKTVGSKPAPGSRAAVAAELLKLARRADERTPARVPTRARLALALDAVGETTELRDVFDDLRGLAGHADLDTPLLQRLSGIADRLGLPADWRRPRGPRPDLGKRPPLASLGPFRWQASPAPELDVPAMDGRLRLTEYRGRPVLLIFFLGLGCVHCVEQLQAMQPRIEEFRNAGIEVLAVGTDTVDELRSALADGEPYPFRLAADPGHDAFRHFRAWDDFENLPLHGTFLIDGDGRMRWTDVGYEPFMDIDFLLAESQRMLGAAATDATSGSH